MLVTLNDLHVGMCVRFRSGKKTWRVTAVDTRSGWVILDRRCFVHEQEIRAGRLVAVDE